ncbi:DUF4132 domain-containing protein [Piscinibacter sp. XHJ-5]|uniref:DUF4132 domain-containing protein n=1 Tax=Piscinibacter sp. XHJ-5 TaxID=3037797 RepID=UPI002453085A|nr:DUF4132 domain-containing protein [Piscinibacter sp. XHJ-5]
MLKWVGKLLGGTSVDLPPDVPSGWVRCLEEALEPLRAADADLARQILDFVCRGEPIGVLHTAAKGPTCAEKLGLTWQGRSDAWKKLYRDIAKVTPRVLLRWAQLLEAAGQSQSPGYQLTFANGVHWPETLLVHASGAAFNAWGSHEDPHADLSADAIEALLVEGGLAPHALLAAAFTTNVKQGYWGGGNAMKVAKLTGYADWLARHVGDVRPLLSAAGAQERLHMVKMLEPAPPHALAALASELADWATSSSKQVRAAAEPLLRKVAAEGVVALKHLAAQAKPEQRVNALRLLWQLARVSDDEALRAFARSTAEADNAPSAQALLAEWAGAASPTVEATRYEYTLPTIDWRDTLTDAVSQALDRLWEDMNAGVEEVNRQGREFERRSQSSTYKHRHTDRKPFSPSERQRVRDHLADDVPRSPRERVRVDRLSYHAPLMPMLERFAAAPGVTPQALVKLLDVLGQLDASHGRFGGSLAVAFNAMHRASGRPTLLELQLLLEPLGHGAEMLLRECCNTWGHSLARDWSDAAQWPFFAHNVELLLRYMNPTLMREHYWFDRSGLFRAIATLPAPPDAIVNVLFDLALGSAKTERAPAQQALSNLAGKELRITNALADGKAEARTVAAQWLGALKHAAAQPALEKALLKEKNDVAKGAMLDALEALGQPVEKYLDRSALLKDAAASLAKGLPKDIEWFPFAAMPRVRWADDESEVDPDVLRAFVVQATKQKSPEPNAVLRKYCRMFHPRDREAFGQFVLEAWLREDVKPISAEEAMRQARASAQGTHAAMQRYPQYYKDDANFGKSVEELYAACRPGFLRMPVGSAAASKGLLALAAACAHERAAPAVARYLKEYYGTRASQGKSLIAMLAWVEHPSATQLMLSIGNRFRTKSFQEEAMKQAEALAERRGWSVAELADRTIPSAGFDETGTQELSYGPRTFVVRLLPDFKLELLNPDGRKIAALPEPRQDDDADLAKAAKKAFSSARKEIKGIVDQQTERLYEALCTERDWRYEDWELYLNQHPIVRRLVQRLVWAVTRDGGVVQTFRPLDDGTLTDCDDNPVHVAPDARVRVAHDSILSAEAVGQWQQHLADYEIAPLFQQLGKGIYALPEGKSQAEEIGDFEGHLLETFALRGRALKLGYTRGSTEDGGWFTTYEKRFPTLGLQALLEFTGNPLPEQNRTVALLSLSFASLQPDSHRSGKLKLAKVPKVLLSECYNDLRLIAAEGTGFHADWRKKSEY